MEHHDFTEILGVLGIPFKEGEIISTESYSSPEVEAARTAICLLDNDKADLVREWLVGFSFATYVEHDSAIALAIGNMKDDEAVLHYFSILFTNFWC